MNRKTVNFSRSLSSAEDLRETFISSNGSPSDASSRAASLVADWTASLKACLNSDRDYLVLESGSRWLLSFSLSGRSIRRDGHHQLEPKTQGGNVEETKIALVPPKTALATAWGMAASLREGQQSDGWVVVLIDASSLAQQVLADSTNRLRTPARRVCLVVVEPLAAEEPGHQPSNDLPSVPANLWEALEGNGFHYVGPIEACESSRLVSEMAEMRTLGKPTVVHVRAPIDSTKPGTMRKANSDRSGTVFPAREMPAQRYLDVARDELLRLANHNSRIRIIDMMSAAAEDAVISDSGPRFLQRNATPERVLTWCAGLSAGGGHPVLLLASDHLPNCWESLSQELADSGVGVTILICDGARAPGHGGDDSSSSILHSEAMAQTLLMVPKDGAELRQMLRLSLRMNGPSLIHIPDAPVANGRHAAVGVFQPGTAEWLVSGQRGVVLAAGPSLSVASKAVEILKTDGLDVGLINLRFLAPLDLGLIDEATRQAAWISVIEERPFQEGLGALVARLLRSRGNDIPVDVFSIASSDVEEIRDGVPWNPRVVHALATELRARAADGSDEVERDAWPDADPEQASGGFSRFSISEDLLQSERRLIQQTVLSPEIETWVEAYEKIGHRTRFLWQWCRHGLQLTTLPCVPEDMVDEVCDTKLLAVMLGVLLDDVADRQEDRRFLDELEAVVMGHRPADFHDFLPDQAKYGEFTRDLWDAFQERTSQYPYYEVYRELLRYDNQQILNTMRYSLLINENLNLLNTVEHDLYLPHNMQMMSFATIDCMCSPGFDCSELGKVREAIWHAQCMGRIGNLVSTWQREISDGDFSSGVFARALIRGELTLQQLQARDRNSIEAAILGGNHEGYFLQRWEHHRNRLEAMRPQIRSFDLSRLIEGLDRLLHMELGSRGLK